MTHDQQRFVKTFVASLFEKDAAIFAGAGLSVSAGYVDWKGLLKDIAEDLGLEISRETDLLSVAQYHYNKHGRNKLNQKIIAEFTADAKETENHRILARLPISTIWTTNYDTLIEDTIKKIGRRPDVKYTVAQLANSVPKKDVTVYKMHGDVAHPNDAVLTKDDYERYYRKYEPFITALSGDLVTKTFLFIGFSFTDPNLDYILSRVRQNFTDNTKNHYCFVRRVKLGDNNAKDQAEFEYSTKRQALVLADLSRVHIEPIVIDEYDEITEILTEIEMQYKRKTVFISGSAEEYGRFSRNDAIGFVHKLSSEIVKANYSIVNGFGWGIGSAIINGALEAIYAQPGKFSESQLIMRPFPQFKTGQQELPDLWREYRERIIKYAGVALFIFGNKIEDGTIISAQGVRKEFEIAKAQGLLLLPIGSTGSMSRELWDEVNSKFDEYYPNAPEGFAVLFQILNDDDITPSKLVDIIKKMLSLLTNSN